MPCRRKFMSVALLTKQANFPKIVSPRPNPSNLLGLKDSIFCFPYFFCARCFNEVGALFCEFFGASTPRKRVLFHIIPYYSLIFIRLDSLSPAQSTPQARGGPRRRPALRRLRGRRRGRRRDGGPQKASPPRGRGLILGCGSRSRHWKKRSQILAHDP